MNDIERLLVDIQCIKGSFDYFRLSLRCYFLKKQLKIKVDINVFKNICSEITISQIDNYSKIKLLKSLFPFILQFRLFDELNFLKTESVIFNFTENELNILVLVDKNCYQEAFKTCEMLPVKIQLNMFCEVLMFFIQKLQSQESPDRATLMLYLKNLKDLEKKLQPFLKEKSKNDLIRNLKKWAEADREQHSSIYSKDLKKINFDLEQSALSEQELKDNCGYEFTLKIVGHVIDTIKLSNAEKEALVEMLHTMRESNMPLASEEKIIALLMKLGKANEVYTLCLKIKDIYKRAIFLMIYTAEMESEIAKRKIKIPIL